MFDGVNNSFTTDRFNRANRALSLNSGYFKIPSGIYFDGSDFTFTCWVKVKQRVNYARIFEVANGRNLDAVVFTIHSDGRPVFSYSNSETFTLFSFSNTVLALNVWYHLAFTYQYPTSMIYVNGILTDTVNTTYSTPIRNLTRSVNWVGRSNWYPQYDQPHAIHDLDDMKLFNGALTNSEIFFAFKTL